MRISLLPFAVDAVLNLSFEHTLRTPHRTSSVLNVEQTSDARCMSYGTKWAKRGMEEAEGGFHKQGIRKTIVDPKLIF